ncbi:hypothetical protein V5O48_012582 [Marasmius crinis-equi]|uniref:Uncharacterized protein n=1 Tax=Marasmius crinis-equi TaxID=585013 RepID=A0ABR3F2F0_9AGAR
MPCVRWNQSASLFYWSFDPEGKEQIPETDWERHGIPKLNVETWIGTSWHNDHYRATYEYLQMEKHNIYGGQYARDRRYPIISRCEGFHDPTCATDTHPSFLGDPHNPDTSDREQSDKDEVTSCFGVMSPSSCSLVEIPNKDCTQSSTEIEGKNDARESKVARWVKGLLKRDGKCVNQPVNCSIYGRFLGKSTTSDDQSPDSDTWSVIEREGS